MKVTVRTAKALKAKLTSAKGQFSSATWKSSIKPSAKFSHVEIEKITTAVVRSGIDFSNLKSVKEGIKSGERSEVGSLPWGEWIDFPYVIGHKGKEYLRLYPSHAPNHVPNVKYFVNGKEVSKSEVLPYLTPSKARELTQPKEAVECFTIKADNVMDVIEITK